MGRYIIMRRKIETLIKTSETKKVNRGGAESHSH